MNFGQSECRKIGSHLEIYIKIVCFSNNQSLQISFSDEHVRGKGSSKWMYAINLCHGLDKNVNATNGGCRNATVSKIFFTEFEIIVAALCLVNEPEH